MHMARTNMNLPDNIDREMRHEAVDLGLRYPGEFVQHLWKIYKKYKEVEKMDWIELKEQIGDYEGLELWKAVCHYDGHETEGYALAGPDECDFFDIDPRGMADITNGLRLPAYMPGFSLEE
jgi:hypothetical protein